MDVEEGRKLIRLARDAIFGRECNCSLEFDEKKGVFTTLHTYPNRRLRGCIGFVEPIYTLSEGVRKSARLAAYHDRRFFPINKEENFIVEISVLTKLVLLKVKNCDEYLRKIKIGRDGLFVVKEGYSGLLLPKVAVEHKMDVKQFLECTCEKAGLGKDRWKDKDCKVYVFQAEVFSEIEPDDEVIKLS